MGGSALEGGTGELPSQRLEELLDDILAGRAPNAGRFCGNCYHPLAPGRESCPYCGRPVAEEPVADSIPRAIVEAHRVRRNREALVVRGVAWGGLTVGVAVALLPIAFGGVHWWSIGGFFSLLAFFYLFSANLANSLGDALGYRWGLAAFRRRWQRFKEEERRTGA